MVSYIFVCLCFIKIVSMHYYAGVFNKNDFLVAQDTLYKERVPYRTTQSMYGRFFKCPITYYRVMDRLGMGRGPRVQVTRGGLRHRFITLRITSQYNLPTSVTILVGCENKNLTTKGPTSPATPEEPPASPGKNDTSKSPGNTDSPKSSDDAVSPKSPGHNETSTLSGDVASSPSSDNVASSPSSDNVASSPSSDNTASSPASDNADSSPSPGGDNSTETSQTDDTVVAPPA